MPIDPEKLAQAGVTAAPTTTGPGIGATLSKALDVVNKPLVDYSPALKTGLQHFAEPGLHTSKPVAELKGFLRGAIEGATKPTTIAQGVGLGQLATAAKAAQGAGIVAKGVSALSNTPAWAGRTAGAINSAQGLQAVLDPNATPLSAGMGAVNAVLGGAEMAMPTGGATKIPTPGPVATPPPPVFRSADEFLKAAESEPGITPAQWNFVKAKQAEDEAQRAVTNQNGPWNDAVQKYVNNVEPRALQRQAQAAMTGDPAHEVAAMNIRKQALDAGVANSTTSNRIINTMKAGQKAHEQSMKELEKTQLNQQRAADDFVATARKAEAQEGAQTTKNENIRQRTLDEQEAQAEIAAKKEGLVAQPPSVSETVASKTGGTTERATTRFAPPEPPETGEGGGGGATIGGGGPNAPRPRAKTDTIYPNKDQAIRDEHRTGAIGTMKAPMGRGWMHVFPETAPEAPKTELQQLAEKIDPNAGIGKGTELDVPDNTTARELEAQRLEAAGQPTPEWLANKRIEDAANAPIPPVEEASPTTEAGLQQAEAGETPTPLPNEEAAGIPEIPAADDFSDIEAAANNVPPVPETALARRVLTPELAGKAPLPAGKVTPASIAKAKAYALRDARPNTIDITPTAAENIPNLPPAEEPPAAAPIKAPKGPKGPTPSAAASRARVMQKLDEAGVPQAETVDLTNPPNLTKSAPSADINDVDLATGVTATKQIKVPTQTFKTPEEAGAAAKEAGLPETSIDKFKGGFRVAGIKPYFKPTEGGAIAEPPTAFHKPEGVVLENTKGAWNRTEFAPKGEEAPTAEAPLAPEQEAAGNSFSPNTPMPSSGVMRTEGAPTQTIEPPTQATPNVPKTPEATPATPPKAGLRVGRSKTAVKELSPEELDKLSDKERFDYFKKVGPLQAATFPFRHNIKLPDAVKADWEQLAQEAPTMNKTAIYNRLKPLWTRTGQARTAAEGPNDPAIGSPRWHDLYAKYVDAPGPEPTELARAEGEGLNPKSNFFGSESGFVDPHLLGKALGTAVSAGLTGSADPVGKATGGHHPLLSAALGGGAYLAGPAILRNWKPGVDYSKIGSNLNAIHNAGLLSPLSVLKKGAADVGGLISAGVEHPDKAGGILRALMNPHELAEAYRAGKSTFKAPNSEEISGAEELLNKTPLSWAGRTMGGLTGATKHVLGEAGFSPLDQGYYTMTSKPLYKPTAKLYEAINSSPLLKNVSPFARIGINRIERGFERSPLGLIQLFKKGMTPEQRMDVWGRAMKGTLGAEAANQLTPDDFVKKHPIAASIASAAAGPYGLPIGAAMAMKTAAKSGGINEASRILARDIPGFQTLEYLGRSPLKEFPQTYLAGYTNAAKPVADLMEPEEKVITNSPRYNLLQNLTYRALSNLPVARGMLPHHKIHTEPLTQQELDMVNEILDNLNKGGQ